MQQHCCLAIAIGALQLNAKAPQTRHMLENLLSIFSQWPPLIRRVPQSQAAISSQIDIPDLDIGLTCSKVVLL